MSSASCIVHDACRCEDGIVRASCTYGGTRIVEAALSLKLCAKLCARLRVRLRARLCGFCLVDGLRLSACGVSGLAALTAAAAIAALGGEKQLLGMQPALLQVRFLLPRGISAKRARNNMRRQRTAAGLAAGPCDSPVFIEPLGKNRQDLIWLVGATRRCCRCSRVSHRSEFVLILIRADKGNTNARLARSMPRQDTLLTLHFRQFLSCCVSNKR